MEQYESNYREAVRRLQVLAADHEELRSLLWGAWELCGWLTWLQLASGSDVPINNPFALKAVRDESAWVLLERQAERPNLD